MHQKISNTLKEEILQKIYQPLKEITYRKNSHIVGIAQQKFLEGKE